MEIRHESANLLRVHLASGLNGCSTPSNFLLSPRQDLTKTYPGVCCFWIFGLKWPSGKLLKPKSRIFAFFGQNFSDFQQSVSQPSEVQNSCCLWPNIIFRPKFFDGTREKNFFWSIEKVDHAPQNRVSGQKWTCPHLPCQVSPGLG